MTRTAAQYRKMQEQAMRLAASTKALQDVNKLDHAAAYLRDQYGPSISDETITATLAAMTTDELDSITANWTGETS